MVYLHYLERISASPFSSWICQSSDGDYSQNYHKLPVHLSLLILYSNYYIPCMYASNFHIHVSESGELPVPLTSILSWDIVFVLQAHFTYPLNYLSSGKFVSLISFNFRVPKLKPEYIAFILNFNMARRCAQSGILLHLLMFEVPLLRISPM